MRATLPVFLATGAGVILEVATAVPAGAATAHAPGSRPHSSNGPAGGAALAAADPDTTVTCTVTSGALTLSVPASATLGSGAPGTIISAPIGPATVTGGVGNNTASWDPTVAVNVPPSAVAGTYTGTPTQSVA